MSINIPQFTLPDLSSSDYRALDPRTFDWANVDFKLLGTDIIVIGIVLLIVACIYSLIFRVRKAREEIEKITSRGSLEGIYQGSAEQAAAQLQKELYETGDKHRKERDKERKQAEKKAKEAKPEPTAKKEILPRNYNGSASVETEYVQRGFTTLGSESPEESPASMLEDIYSATSILENTETPTAILETETPTAILDEGDSSSAKETDEYATSILDDDVSSGEYATSLLETEEYATSLLDNTDFATSLLNEQQLDNTAIDTPTPEEVGLPARVSDKRKSLFRRK